MLGELCAALGDFAVDFAVDFGDLGDLGVLGASCSGCVSGWLCGRARSERAGQNTSVSSMT